MTTDEALEYASCILGAPSGKTEETVVILAAEVRRLRQRHAEAVNSIKTFARYVARLHGYQLSDAQIDAAWLASEAKARLT